MALIHSTAAARAARFAAMASTAPSSPGDVHTVAALQNDLATLLLESVMAVTGLKPQVFVPRVAEVARHPVQQLLSNLSALPRLDDRAAPDPPSTRWRGVPHSPDAAISRVDHWKGLVVAAAVMTNAVQSHARQLSEDERWAVVRDVTALVEVLAVTRLDLLAEADLTISARNASRRSVAALALAAREVARLAGDEPFPATATIPIPPGRGHRPMPVNEARQLALATNNLAVLLVRHDASISDLLAISRILAQTSRATAAALRAADRGRGDSHLVPATLTAIVLERHAAALTRAVVSHRAILAPLTPSNAIVGAQAREIATGSPPLLDRLARHPVDAGRSAPALAAYARAVTLATTALAQAGDACVLQHAVAIRDRSDEPRYPWRPAHHADVQPYLHVVADAATELRTGLANVAAVTGPDRAAGPVATDAITALRAALERRQIALRPRHPGGPALTPWYEQVHRVGAASWIP